MRKQNFPEPFNIKPIHSLNQKITIEEIKESINYLKTKKATSLDNITNEMIKCSDRNIIEHLQTLFIIFMESSYYPSSRNQGLICTIYKFVRIMIQTTTQKYNLIKLSWEAFLYNLI